MNNKTLKKRAEALKEQLRSVAARWRENMREIGRILLEMERERMPVDLIIAEILHGEVGMSIAEGRVALRWWRTSVAWPRTRATCRPSRAGPCW